MIMHVGVHCNGIVIVTPPSNITISLVHGAGEPGNGAAAIGIVEAVVARFFARVQQILAMFLDIVLNLRAGHSRRVT